MKKTLTKKLERSYEHHGRTRRYEVDLIDHLDGSLLQDAIAVLQDIIGELPDDARDARIDFTKRYVDGDEYPVVHVLYNVLETDKEYAARLAEEKASEEARLAHERETYEALKAKFAPQ